MSAIRKLAAEAADNGLLAPELAAGISRVKSAKTQGVRVGNWLSLRQAQALLSAPDTTTIRGLRDRAILAVLLGCGLRRSEVAALTFSHLQQRDGRWCIVDLVGKHGRVRTAPMQTWVKVAIEAWATPADVTTGHVFRSVNRANRVMGEGLGEKSGLAVDQALCRDGRSPRHRPTRSPPHMRQTMPRRRRRARADSATAGPRVGPNNGTVSRHETGSCSRT